MCIRDRAHEEAVDAQIASTMNEREAAIVEACAQQIKERESKIREDLEEVRDDLERQGRETLTQQFESSKEVQELQEVTY